MQMMYGDIFAYIWTAYIYIYTSMNQQSPLKKNRDVYCGDKK